jgi:CRP/FNR family cyclic AMP-dependent transcriptional regulator
MTTNPQTTVDSTAIEHFLRHCLIQSYPPRQTFIRAGEKDDRLYYIVEGSVSVSSQNEGHGLVYSYLNQGQFIGEVGFFYPAPIKTVDVRTRRQSKLASIPYSQFEYLLKNELADYAVDLLFIIGEQLANRLLMVSRHLRDLAFIDTEGRIAKCLLDLCQEPGVLSRPDGIQIHITRKELSRLVGCSREMAGKFLKDLEEKALIAINGKNILVYPPK